MKFTILMPGDFEAYYDALIAIGKPKHADYARRYYAWLEGGRPRSSDGPTDTPHPTTRSLMGVPNIARGAMEADLQRIHRGQDIRQSSSYQRNYVKPHLNRRKPTRTSSSPRDSQRSKVYRAEREAFPKFEGTEERFRTVADIEAYVDKILGSAWWQRRYHTRTIKIKDGRGTTYARGGHRGSRSGVMNLPLWARNEPVILHELAHVASGATYGTIPAHGREFCKVFLDLVRWKMGDEAWRSLKDAFREGKVKHTLAPRTREMTDEQREAARQRLAAARKAQTPSKD